MGDKSPTDLLAGMMSSPSGFSPAHSPGAPGTGANQRSIEELMSKLASTNLAKATPVTKKRMVVCCCDNVFMFVKFFLHVVSEKKCQKMTEVDLGKS